MSTSAIYATCSKCGRQIGSVSYITADRKIYHPECSAAVLERADALNKLEAAEARVKVLEADLESILAHVPRALQKGIHEDAVCVHRADGIIEDGSAHLSAICRTLARILVNARDKRTLEEAK